MDRTPSIFMNMYDMSIYAYSPTYSLLLKVDYTE